ncbi:MAG: pyrroloquinoline quinone biosynthesis protein PqqE [Myxococcota bacterium]
MTAPRPYNLVAELTYRCPLRCPYCSNPTDYAQVGDGLDATDWGRVFREAAALGVVHVGLTGGEPSARRDLSEIVAGATEASLYTHLVTAGLPLDAEGLRSLRAAGLRSVQLSIQDSRPSESDALAGTRSFERKLSFAREVRALGLPLTLNVVLHRGNLSRVAELVELARSLDCERVELANVQLHGFALANRQALLPTREALDEARQALRRAQPHGRRPEVLFVLPDYWSDRPKPCMGGWARSTLVVRPDGLVLPCHSAAGLPGLEFHSVRHRPLRECWEEAQGMNVFRGEAWMPEPCRSCPERSRDFGGCRCQAFALTGQPAATDPACSLSPHHDRILAARRAAGAGEPPPLQFREPRLGI